MKTIKRAIWLLTASAFFVPAVIISPVLIVIRLSDFFATETVRKFTKISNAI